MIDGHRTADLWTMDINRKISPSAHGSDVLKQDFSFKANNLCFDLILNAPVNNFQLCQDGFSWVEPVLSKE